MGTSVSLASPPEPIDVSLVDRAREILKQNPLRMASMVRLGRMISEADNQEKMELLSAGIIKWIVELISTYHTGWRMAKADGVVSIDKHVNSATGSVIKISGSKNRRRNSGFVTQITVGRRKTNSAVLNRGVGYSCGTTRCQWDIERYIEEAIVREEQLTWLMKILTAYLYTSSPDFSDPDVVFENVNKGESNFAADQIAELLRNSTIVPMIRHHLRNESIFDISERLEFYNALLDMLCSLAIHPSLTCQVLQPERPNEESLLRNLLPRFRSLIVSYLAFTRLKLRTPDLRLTEFLETVDTCQRLLSACHKRHFDQQVSKAKLPLTIFPITVTDNDSTSTSNNGIVVKDKVKCPVGPSVNQSPSAYVRVMKAYQIRSWRFIDENGKWLVPYAYHKEAKSLNPLSPSLKDRGKRIAREIASFENNLPLSDSNSIFVCVEESRCDVMKVLITGPDQTPYQNGCFEFDLFFPVSYPFSPPKMTFLTTNGGEVRFNPNLYQDGKVCLSILNTWEGRPEEKWNPYCSLLQLLVSIQALIFVKEPYYNEPGFEKYMCTERGQQLSRTYNQQLKHATLQVAIVEQLQNAGRHFQDVIEQHIWLKRDAILQQAHQCLNEVMSGRTEGMKHEGRKLLYATDSEAMSLKVVGQTVETINKELWRLEQRMMDRKDASAAKPGPPSSPHSPTL